MSQFRRKLPVFIAMLMLLSIFGLLKAENEKEAAEIKKISDIIDSSDMVKPKKARKILLYSKTGGYRHSSIPTCDAMVKALSEKTKAFKVDVAKDVTVFTKDNLKKYDAVLFNNTTRVEKNIDIKGDKREALLDFIKNGGGFIGIHAASDAGYKDWPEYTKMIGGSFAGHPWSHTKTPWGIHVEDTGHPVVKSFGEKNHKVIDELYQFQSYSRDDKRVLLTINLSDKVTGALAKRREDRDYAIAWVKAYGKGRVFYSSLGHNEKMYYEKDVLSHFLAGIQYALGDLKVDTDSIKKSTREAKESGNIYGGVSVKKVEYPKEDEKIKEDALIKVVAAGKTAYANCFACHQLDGKGLIPNTNIKMAPSFVTSTRTKSSDEQDKKKIVATVIKGMTGLLDGEKYLGAMVPLPISDKQISDVLTYVRQKYSKVKKPYISEKFVKTVRDDIKSRTTPWTQKELDKKFPAK